MSSTALTTYSEKWEQKADRAVEFEPLLTGQWLSVKGGQLMIGDVALPGNQACMIVLDSVFENTYYGKRYDQDNPMPPICYAMARPGQELFPHIEMQKDPYFEPQHWDGQYVAGCQGCPMNEWGSADQGKGKACQNRRRLTVIPAGQYLPKKGSRDFDLELFDDAKTFQSVEEAHFKLPVTSVGNWAKYVNQVAGAVRRPPAGVITRVYVEPHPTFQYTVCFEMIDIVPDEFAEVIMARNEAAEKVPLVGYQAPDAERLAKQKNGSVRGGGGGFRQGAR